VCKFRHLLEEHQLGELLFGKVNLHLQAKGIRITTARLWTRPSCTHPLRPRTKKGKQWYFGIKAHHQPALLLGPLGVIAIPNPAAMVPIFGPVTEELRQRKYRRSELSLQQFKLHSATSASAVGVAIRYKADGQELGWWALPTCCTKEMTVGSLPSWCYTIPTKLCPANNRTYMLNRRDAL
jgi:hypothetical protein